MVHFEKVIGGECCQKFCVKSGRIMFVLHIACRDAVHAIQPTYQHDAIQGALKTKRLPWGKSARFRFAVFVTVKIVGQSL